MGIEQLAACICFWHRGGQNYITRRDPRSLSFPLLFRLSCGATYDPSAGRMQCLGTPTEPYTSIRKALGRKQGLMEKLEEKDFKEEQQLGSRTHSITLTMHLQPLCVSACRCMCVCCSVRELQHHTVPTHSTGGPNKNL